MNLYFDTSALVKLFSKEDGSEKVKEIINNENYKIWVLDLAQLELFSAIYRKFRNNVLAEDSLKPLQEAIRQQFVFFNVMPMASDVVEEARTLIDQFGKVHGLRTLDALHIAGFMLISESDWAFVSSDKNQVSVIELLGQNQIFI